MAPMPPSTAFLEIEDSKARSEKMASHTHLPHYVPPTFCHEDISEEKQGFSCDTICALHGGWIYQ